MNHTTNYNLNQWEAGDKVQRVDFNADNAKIDAAIAAVDAHVTQVQSSVPQIVTGTYTGNGAASRFIPLPFTPKAVLVCASDGRMFVRESVYHSYVYGGLAITGRDVTALTTKTALSIRPNGFQVFYIASVQNSDSDPYTNCPNVEFQYLAIG